MSYTRRIMLVAIVLIPSSCVGLLLFGDWPLNGTLAEKLEADLDRQLPLGSTWEQAEEWFRSHDIPYYNIGGGDTEAVQRVGMYAMVPDNGLLTAAEVHIELYFADGRLSKRSVRRFVISL